MAKSFDEILKKGKGVANEHDPEKKWKDSVSRLMYELHNLNRMYGDDKKHHIKVVHKKCSKCKAATFIISVEELKDQSKTINFHKGDWKAVGSEYHCDQCKGKK